MYGNQQSCGCKKKEHESTLGTYLTRIDGTSIDALKSSKLPSNSTTGVKGVYLIKGRYKAKIVFQKKQFFLGTYRTLTEAAAARKKAEEVLKNDVVAFYEQWASRKSNPLSCHEERQRRSEIAVIPKT